MLLEVRNMGAVLVLLDGRRLRVDAQYIPTTCIWLPTSKLELQNLPSGMAVVVTNLEDNERITAQWDMDTGEQPSSGQRKNRISRKHKRLKSKCHG